LLKTRIEHFYSSQENYDLQLVRMKLDKEGLDELEAMQNGWLIANNDWYQCRSVRINIEEYLLSTRKPDLPKSITFKLLHHTQVVGDAKESIERIAKEFADIKCFEWEYNIFSDFERSKWLMLYDDGIPVAFTKFIIYKGGVESQYTAWNYHKPKLSIGKHIVYYEVHTAMEVLGIKDHLYIGQGCERGSMYKAAFNGFEWWTGSEWSLDKTAYEKLCARDSTINTLPDLAKLYKYAETI
jgi:hypothetical protein